MQRANKFRRRSASSCQVTYKTACAVPRTLQSCMMQKRPDRKFLHHKTRPLSCAEDNFPQEYGKTGCRPVPQQSCYSRKGLPPRRSAVAHRSDTKPKFRKSDRWICGRAKACAASMTASDAPDGTKIRIGSMYTSKSPFPFADSSGAPGNGVWQNHGCRAGNAGSSPRRLQIQSVSRSAGL